MKVSFLFKFPLIGTKNSSLNIGIICNHIKKSSFVQKKKIKKSSKVNHYVNQEVVKWRH